MLKIRRSRDRLIFNMGITIPGKALFTLNRALVSAPEELTKYFIMTCTGKWYLDIDLMSSVQPNNLVIFILILCAMYGRIIQSNLHIYLVDSVPLRTRAMQGLRVHGGWAGMVEDSPVGMVGNSPQSSQQQLPAMTINPLFLGSHANNYLKYIFDC